MRKIKRQIYKYLLYLKPFSWLIFLIFFIIFLYSTFPSLVKIFNQTIKGPKLAFSLLTADTSSLESHNNRTNLLILGASGSQSKTDDLTDTMIFVSIDRASADVVMLSIPRDIWLDSLQAKINTAYHYGEKRKKGGGFVLAKDAAYEVFNQPIHYGILIDFEGFVKIIDLLGGLDIKVDRSFDDYKYPIAGKENDDCNGDSEYKCRYEHLHFDTGWQQMNGQLALKFVRSRNAEGEEGTDFARSQRQRKVILALKDKIFSAKVLLNPKKVIELKKTFGNHLIYDTQFNEEQITAFLSLFLRFVKNKNQIRTISLDIGDEDSPGFLYNPPLKEYDQWVLIPRTEDWNEIQRYVEEKIYKGY